MKEPANKTHPFKIGITGGIGSGKTTVCKIFETLDIPVYYSDDRAKALMIDNRDLVSDIKYHFGPQVYKKGKLERAFLANIVFNNPDALTILNKLVHPRVAEDYLSWHNAQDAPFTLKEAALTIEIGGHKKLDALIVVTAEKETRIHRVMKRDQISREQILNRINKQLPQSEKDKLADYLIDNNGDKALVTQVWDVYQKIINNAAL